MSNDRSTSSSSPSLQNTLTKSQTGGITKSSKQSKRKKTTTNKKKTENPGTSKTEIDKNTSTTKEKLEENPTSQISTEKKDNILESKKIDLKSTESFEALPIIQINDETNSIEVIVDDKNPQSKVQESSHQPIDLLPDELVIRIFSFLSENDLFRTSEVCRRWNRLSFDLDLWEEKSKRWMSAQNLIALNRTRNWFLQKYQEEERWKKENTERRQREQQTLNDIENYDQRRRRARVCERFLHYAFFTLVSDYLTMLLIILGTILIALRLDFVILWSWSLVLIPWYVLGAQAVVIMTVTDIARLIWRDELPQNLASKQWVVWAYFMNTGCRLFQHITLWSLIAFLILLAIKETSPNLIPWWAVLLPLVIWTLILVQAPLTGCFAVRSVRSGFYCIERVILSIFALLFLCFLVLFWLRIELYIFWKWSQVLFPIWILFGAIVVIPIIIWIFLFFLLCWLILLLPVAVLYGRDRNL